AHRRRPAARGRRRDPDRRPGRRRRPGHVLALGRRRRAGRPVDRGGRPVTSSPLTRPRAAAPTTSSWFVPGRVEILGKHTDYAGGRSLLAAVDLGHTVTARAREDRVLRVVSSLAQDAVEVDLDALAEG